MLRLQNSLCFGIVAIVTVACLPSATHAQSSRAQEMMQEHQDRVKEMREKSSFGSDKFDEMRRESDERMAEARQRQEEMFSDLENRSTSSSSGSDSNGGFRIRGRAIRGILFLVAALGAGAMKLFGFLGGNRGE